MIELGLSLLCCISAAVSSLWYC